jgi:hypothetical protein
VILFLAPDELVGDVVWYDRQQGLDLPCDNYAGRVLDLRIGAHS